MATLTLRPNEAGDETSIQYQSPSSTYHWDKVDEAVADDGDTDINDTTGSYKRDLYALPSHTTETGIINSIKIYFRCIRAGATHAKPSQKSGTIVTDGTEVALTTSWVTYSQTYTTNPATGSAYTWDEIDALQIGVALSSEGGTNAVCTQVYVGVNYTPTPIPVADGDLIGIGIIRKS